MSAHDPFFAPVAQPHGPEATPITAPAVERLVHNTLARAGATSDDLLTLADALRELLLEAPSDSDTRRLRELERRLRWEAPRRAGLVPGKAEAEALLVVCPADLRSLRMWRAAMGGSCSAWGWTPILDALIAAAEGMQPPASLLAPLPGGRPRRLRE